MEEGKLARDEHLSLLSKDIRDLLENNNLATPEALLFIYTNLPKPILLIIQTNLSLPDINSTEGNTLKLLIKSLRIEESVREERIKTNARILQPYWDKMEEQKEFKRRKVKERARAGPKYEEYGDKIHKTSTARTILEKYTIASKVEAGVDLLSIVKEYGVKHNKLCNWVVNLKEYKRLLDLNSLFGKYHDLHPSLLINYQIGQYLEEHDMESTIEHFNVKKERACNAKKWYVDLKAGIFRKIKDPRRRSKTLKEESSLSANDIKSEMENKIDILKEDYDGISSTEENQSRSSTLLNFPRNYSEFTD